MPGLFDRIKDTTTFSGLLTVGTSFVVNNDPAPIYQTFRNRYSINDANISVAITSQTSNNWMVCWCTYTNVDTLRVDEIIFTSNTSTPDAPVTFSGTSDVFVTASSRAVAGLREANTFTGGNYFTSANAGVIGIGNTSPHRKIDITGGGFSFTDSGGASGRAIHWGDRDTAIFPVLLYGIATAADTHLSVRIAPFGSTGSEKLRIDSSGNVGIGTTSPAYRLDVTGQARIGNSVTQAAPSATDILSTAHVILGGSGGNYITTGQYAAAQNYAAWIQSSFANPTTAVYNLILQPLGGNVGIRTNAPEAPLHVLTPTLGTGAGNTQRINRSTTSIGGNTALFDIDARRHTAGSDWGGTNVRLSRTIDSTLTGFIDLGIDGEVYSQGIGFGTNGASNRVVIDGNGRLGVGTASPSALLTIDDNAATGTGLVLTGGGSGGNLASFIRDVGANAAVKINASGGDPQIAFESPSNTFTIGADGNDFKISDDPVLGNNDRLIINSSGSFGLNTTPVANGSVVKLWVAGDISMPTTNRTILWNGYFNSASGQWNYSGNGYLFALRENGGGKLEFFTSGNNTGGAGAVAGMSMLMSLDATAAAPGNVGIGTASPLARLHVAGGDVRLDNNRALRFANVAGTGTSTFLLQNDNNFVAYNPAGTPVFSFQSGATPVAAYGANTNNRLFLDASLNYMTLITNGSERLRINDIGDVGVGTSSPESRLHSTGTFTIRSGTLAYMRFVVGAGQDNSGYIETRVGGSSTTLPAGSRVGFLGWYNGTQFYAAWTDVAVPMIFGTNGTDRLKIEGTGSINTYASFGVNNGTYYYLGTNTIYGNAGGDTYGNFRVLQSVVQNDGMFINYNSAGTTTNAIRFYTPGITERMRISNTGSVAIGTTGGDYGRDWRLVARQDHNADTQVGIINATSGTAANARLTYIVGTANGFIERALYDGNGAPFFRNEYGAGINYEAWMFSGTSRMLLDNRGVLKLVNDQGPASGDTLALGFRGAPANFVSDANYTFVLTDAGKSVIRSASAAARTWTVPASGSVNFPEGTCIIVDNSVATTAGHTITLANTNVTWRSGTGGTLAASPVVAIRGIAVIRKISGSTWVVSGAVT